MLKRYLPLQISKAKKLGILFDKRTNEGFITDIQISPKKNNKYRVFLTDGSYIDYGYYGLMKDGTMSEDFLEHKDPERRKKFLARWSSNPNINNPHSAVFYITRLTW